MSEEVTLDQWLADARERLEAFAAAWRKGAVAEPEIYPLTLPLGDWDEQYRCAEGA